MNDETLARYLRSIGKNFYRTYYGQLADFSLSNADLVARIVRGQGYAEPATRSRVSTARTIIRSGRGLDALNF